MTEIKTFKQLALLENGTRFYVVRNGKVEQFATIGINPFSVAILITVPKDNIKTIKCFGASDFNDDTVFLTGQFAAAYAGNIMVNQLLSEANSVRDIYIKGQ